MFSSHSFRAPLATVFIASFLLITGCGGGGDGGGGGGGTTPTLPANAVTITSSNAAAIAESAIGTLDTFDAILVGAEAESLPSIQAAIKAVTDIAFDRNRRSASVVTGVTETEPCYNGNGSITANYTETTTSFSGTLTFSNCDLGYGLFVNGSFTVSSSWNNSTGAYTDSGNGSLTFTDNSNSFTLVMDYDETGNEFDYSYSTNMSYSVSGIPGGGFLVTTTQNIVGNYYYGYVTSGQFIIQGANNTRLRITITSTNYADVELDTGNGVFDYITSIYI